MNLPLSPASGETSLTIRRSFDADIVTLFRALTDPAAIKEWFGHGSIRVIHVETDLRVGGRWALGMVDDASGEAHNVSGEYVELDAPRKVVFTWAWRSTPDRISRVTYLLSPEGAGRTALTLTHERFFDAAARDRHAQGWAGCLDGLGPWLARQGA